MTLFGLRISGAFLCLFLAPAFAFSQQSDLREDTPVAVPRPAGLTILGATEICEGSETALKAEGEFESFTWSTGEIGRTIHVQKPGTYEVSAKTKGGCMYTASITVRVKPCT